MSSSRPTVTVLVPARDEAQWIRECIERIAAQDHPAALTQVVVVVDAQTADGTDLVAKEALDGAAFGSVEVLRNADGGGTPANLNVGLAAATGEILCRVDARSRIPRDYVRRCAELLTSRPEIAVVGGAQVAEAAADDVRSTGIARALNNRWGMGLARYRRDAPSGPADTVYLGAFRTADLRAVGGWNPEFTTNQDFELNRRMGERGTVWYESGLPVGYVPRPDLRTLYRQYRRFGSWKARYWRRTGDRPRPRQVALLVGVPVAGLGALVAVAATDGPGRLAVVAALVAAAVAVEVRGSHAPRGGWRVHGQSAAATATVGAGWLVGTWGGIFGREPW